MMVQTQIQSTNKKNKQIVANPHSATLLNKSQSHKVTKKKESDTDSSFDMAYSPNH